MKSDLKIQLLRAPTLFIKALCWQCGGDLRASDTMLANPYTERGFCSPECKEQYMKGWLQAKPPVVIYTDGSCLNTGVGGWAAILIFNGNKVVELSGHAEGTTNNRMELTAAIKALAEVLEAHNVTLFTDSQYLRDGMLHWTKAWQRYGWKRPEGGDVKNADLWQQLMDESSRHLVSWVWIKGHSDNPYNERCDQLAGEVARNHASYLKGEYLNL